VPSHRFNYPVYERQATSGNDNPQRLPFLPIFPSIPPKWPGAIAGQSVRYHLWPTNSLSVR
jgi:hypothetical protein